SSLPLPVVEVSEQGFIPQLQQGPETLHQLWLEWSSECLEHSEDVKPEDMDCMALLIANSITERLRVTCSGVGSAIQGLPAALQDKVGESLAVIEELRAAFSAARSIQDLSGSVLTQSQGRLPVIQECMEELLRYLEDNLPLSWLVGPFSPREEEE
ncbi:PLIN3 protein, partial [Upupa epops]|nr:PLIN3 protein [Upupa epops]